MNPGNGQGYGGPPPGYGAPPPGYGAPPPGAPQPGYGAPPPGAPPPGYGAPPPGYGAPPPGYGPPAAGYGAQAQPPTGPPSWVRIVARVFLALGILLAIGTVVGGIMSEQLGMNLAMATPGPLGFGIVATVLSRKSSTGGAAKPLGFGCLVGFVLSLMIVVFFAAIWPSL